MKAELIANIIAAHCSGDESSFKTAVEALAADEDKKGNSRVSSMLLDAYKGKNITLMKKPEIGQPAGGGRLCRPVCRRQFLHSERQGQSPGTVRHCPLGYFSLRCCPAGESTEIPPADFGGTPEQ